MRFATAIALMAVLALSSACSMGSLAPAQTPVATIAVATTVPTPTAAPATTKPTPEPTPAAAQPLAADITATDALTSGRWRTQELMVPVEFEVEDGEWLPLIDSERYFFLRRVPDQPNGVGITPLTNVFIDPCGDGSSGDVMVWPQSSGPAEFFDWLAEHSSVDWGEPEATTIAGHDALSIERVVPDGAYDDPPGQLSIPRPGMRFTLSAVDLGSETIVIEDFAYDGEPYENLHGALETLLESMTFDEV
jgi:hypothetical protein